MLEGGDGGPELVGAVSDDATAQPPPPRRRGATRLRHRVVLVVALLGGAYSLGYAGLRGSGVLRAYDVHNGTIPPSVVLVTVEVLHRNAIAVGAMVPRGTVDRVVWYAYWPMCQVEGRVRTWLAN